MDEFDYKLQQALAKRKAAQDVMGSFRFPEASMVSGHYVRPSFGDTLAQGLRSYNAMKEAEKADTEIPALLQQRTEGTQKALAEFLRQSQGTPANAPQDGVGPTLPAQAPNMQGAYGALMQAPDAGLRQMGMQGMAQIPQMEMQQKQREEERAFRQQEAQLAREARAQELQMRMQDQRATQQEKLAAQRELQQMQIDARKDMQRMIASSRPAPQAQIIQTEQGPMQLQNGRAVPILGPDGKPVQAKPAAGAAAASSGARTKDAQDALATIGMAEKLINQATGSGIGSAIDAAAAFVGKSTPGAQAGAKLKALEGDLVAKMPKMSGPQSDKDVLLYRQMAGQIGDPTVPNETKRAALETIRQMQERYAGVQPEANAEAQAAPTAPKRLKFDAQGNLVP